MAFTKFLYNLINWKNKSESLTTPLGASNLNKMDSAIKTIGDNLNTAYDELSEGKLDKDTANTMISNVSYAESTGIFTIARLNGSTSTIDTKLEKIVTNWDYNEDTQKLILTLEDGTTKDIDLSALITQYEFIDSDTIAFTIESNGTVTANVKDGSITEEKLQPNYLAEVKSNASNAETSAQNASEYADNASYDAKLAQSYAVGGSGIREDEADNAKYYMEQAKSFSEGTASNISYNNSESGAESTNVQEALDELNNKKINKDKISNNFITTEEGYVADARTVRKLNEKVEAIKRTGYMSNVGKTWTVEGVEVGKLHMLYASYIPPSSTTFVSAIYLVGFCTGNKVATKISGDLELTIDMTKGAHTVDVTIESGRPYMYYAFI